MTDKPIPESYWVTPGSFLAGGYPASTEGDEAFTRWCLTAFLNAGFSVFFDLTRPGELPPYAATLREQAAHYGISTEYHHVSIQDRGLPSHDQMKALLDSLDEALSAGRKVYLHCWGGIGRTGMTVGCWLVRHGLDGAAALARLGELYQKSEQSSLYPHSPETVAQMEFILDWKEDGLA